MELMEKYQKPVVFSVWVSDEVKSGDVYKKMLQNHLIPYPTPDRAAKALASLVEYSEYLGVAKRRQEW
jgi:acyl-CoA synthetase (NDP forming)